jgi:DNA modification methylase
MASARKVNKDWGNAPNQLQRTYFFIHFVSLKIILTQNNTIMEVNKLSKKGGQIIEVSIDDIQIHPEVLSISKPKKIDHIEYTIKKFGQQMPVLGYLEEGTFYITDGVARFEAAKNLGIKTLKCLDINVLSQDVIKVRMTSNQRTKMSYMEMASCAEHTLGIIGTSQGKKRNDILGMENFDNDDYFGLAGKDRFELTCHLLDLPVKAATLRKLIEIKRFEDENPGNKIGILKGLDEGIYKVDKAFQLIKEKQKKELELCEIINRTREGRMADVSFRLFNKSSLDLSDIPDKSVRMFIQSPPFYQLRQYRNQEGCEFIHGQERTVKEYIDNEMKFYEGAKKKLLPNGVLVVMIGETYRGGYQGVCTKMEVALEENGWEIVDVNIFAKTNQKAAPHEGRFLNSYERIIVAKLKGAGPVLFNDVKRPSSIGEFKVIPGSSRVTGGTGNSMSSPISSITNVLTTSVFQKSEYSKIDEDFYHQAPTSVDVYSVFVEAYSNPGDTIGDMFVGTGSGLVSALERGRSGLGWDVDIESIEFCTVRLNNCLKEREQAKIGFSIAA